VNGKLKRWLALSMMVVLVMVSLTGCGSSDTSSEPTPTPSEPVTIEFWHTYSDTEEIVFNEQVIPAFEAKYPNIKVKSTRMPYDGLKQQVISAAAGNAAPDAMRMDIVWVPEFAKLGALESLDDKDGFNDIKAQTFEGPLATNYYNGQYYGLPLNTNTKVAIYNKDLLAAAGLAEPPKTFDELIDASKTVKAQGKYGIGIGGTGAWGILPYFWTLGGNVTDENNSKASGYLNSPESIAALEQIIQLYDDKLVAPTLLGGEPSTWDGMKQGDYLMIDDGPWFYSILGDEVKDKTVAAPLPTGKGGSTSVVGGEDVVMFKNGKHPDETWTFVKYLMSDEAQIMMAQTGLIPTTKSAANSEEVQSNELVKPYLTQLETAKPRTPSPSWGKIEESLNLAFEKAVRGEVSAKEALDAAAVQIDAFLQEQ